MSATAVYKKKHNRRVFAVIISCFAIVFLIALLSIFHQPIKNQLNAWKLLPQPERLTELYFTHPNNLPAQYRAGGVETVRFTVHNLEYRTMHYSYQVTEENQDDSKSEVLHAGTFTLKANQYENAFAYIALTDLGPRVKVTVHLTTVNESVDYWLNKVSGSSS